MLQRCCHYLPTETTSGWIRAPSHTNGKRYLGNHPSSCLERRTTLKQDQRGQVIDFVRVHNQIPRNENNDPCFRWLMNENWDHPEDTDWPDPGPAVGSILSVFTPAEVVAMVNRFLYQMEYQRTVHRQRERSKSEELAPIKQKVRELFHIPWT